MTQPVPSIATCFAGSTRTAKMASVGALMVMLTLTVSLATATTSCLMGWNRIRMSDAARTSNSSCGIVAKTIAYRAIR